jgi:hypothetical protein
MVNIETPQGDQESYRFAVQIGTILQSAGWKVRGISQVVFLGGPPTGIDFAVHSKDSVPGDAYTLKEVFDLIGLAPTWTIRSGVPEGTFELRVGHKPN